ncbi:MAG: FAD-linked oxidase C-terminal domain-containing protein, partial [Candidatus Latescibacteria bacterium]|nr:FAD-linked oxidase C-terminal domain-containing protein [Candidatus Latescibacterota bacterium]
MDAEYLAELGSFLRDDQILTSQEDLTVYAYDGTALLHELPGCVVLPETSDQVVRLLRAADGHRVPVVTRGSGTGLSGGSVPVPGCTALCLVRMNRILEVDADNLTMSVEPGVITEKVAEAAASQGLFYPPDPGSMKISTIGGNVANNSGGLRGLKYGVTRDYVMALDAVLADGRVLSTGTKCVKDVAGFSLKDIFIGSEGTLGVITRITLKLIPQPADKRTMLGLFDEMTAAAETISSIIQGKIVPCTLEFLDRVTIRCVEDFAKIGLPLDVEALLLMEVDGHPAEVEDQASRIIEIAEAHGAREIRMAGTQEEADQLASARRSAFSALARLAPTVFLEDVTVPRSELARMVRFIQATAEKYRVQAGTFGHMGDGNLHPTFLTNERDPEEIGRVEEAMGEIFSYAIELGGTI